MFVILVGSVFFCVSDNVFFAVCVVVCTFLWLLVLVVCGKSLVACIFLLNVCG